MEKRVMRAAGSGTGARRRSGEGSGGCCRDRTFPRHGAGVKRAQACSGRKAGKSGTKALPGQQQIRAAGREGPGAGLEPEPRFGSGEGRAATSRFGLPPRGCEG